MALVDFASQDWSTALAPLAGFPAIERRESGLQRLVSRYFNWRARRDTLRMLNALDGATLRDLGISDPESQVYGDPAERRRGYHADWWRKAR